MRWNCVVIGAAVAGFSATALAEAPTELARQAQSILAEHCFQCHGQDAGQRQAGLRLDQRDSALLRLESGRTAIVPERAGDSELIRRVESNDSDVVMPPAETKRRLTADQKQVLRRWIIEGATYAGHWAYQKPVRPAVPPTQNAMWPRNPIDAFVLSKLDAASLAPSPIAVRTTLIRRLSLDLTGLPPTIDDVDDFLSDDAPDADERLVDRLLASPHYGEKLAQDWLDLARFGDTSGYQDDAERLNWPYRDYVIAAFNANLPFDQFTIENLAGDLLPNPTLAQRVASGFNRLHRHNEEGGSDPDEFQVVYTADRTTTTATTWMGLTFGCAQCHDHKYDPFTQREFYELYAFFNSLKGEAVISKGPFPPQVPAPSPDDERRLAAISQAIAETDQRIVQLEAKVTPAFQAWHKANTRKTTTSTASKKTGAVGGMFARTVHTAIYADTRLARPLSFQDSVIAGGRVSVPKSVNNAIEFGHFFAKDLDSGSIGFMIAEGPRFFASLNLSNGERLVAGPITGEHGVEYAWSYRYEPSGGIDDEADPDTVGEGLLRFELQRDGKSIGSAVIDLSAAQRAAAVSSFDAFGFYYRAASDADSPIYVYLDDLEYTAGDESVRKNAFDADPKWTGDGNQAHGHQFGFDGAAATFHGVADLSVAEILALAEDKRSPHHTARLRDHYVRETFPELYDLNARITALRRNREAIEKLIPQALVWEEMIPPQPARLLVRGDYQTPGDTVERNVPAIFTRLPAGPRDRLLLARWLVDGEHPLTSRVAVNRLWKQCFGAGLVRTPEDFGVRGEPPTHPELFDWLAVEFQAPFISWDVKHLLRQIVSSATYRQSSDVTPVMRDIDPANRLLARGARFRLSAEEIRDAALTASGLLTRQLGGRSIYPYQPDVFNREKEDDPGEWRWPLEADAELYRRGLYVFLRRTSPYPPYSTFDAPSRGECTVGRSRTNTPLQALVTLNDPVFVEAARVLGERIALADGDDEGRLTFAFRTVLSRPPTERERTISRTLYESERNRYRRDPTAAAELISQGKAPRFSDLDPVKIAAWTAVAAALLNLDEAISHE